MLNLTLGQAVWLRQHGGRTPSEVYSDEEGPYVLMRDGAKKDEVKVYIPTNPAILPRAPRSPW